MIAMEIILISITGREKLAEQNRGARICPLRLDLVTQKTSSGNNCAFVRGNTNIEDRIWRRTID
jgi:hypothetical protein